MKKKPTKIKEEELFDLNYILAKYILPHLVAFKKMKRSSYPMRSKSLKDWNSMLDEMIYGMRYILKSEYRFDKRAQEGLELFGKHFMGLWD